MSVRIECNNCVISISEEGFRDLMWCLDSAEDRCGDVCIGDGDRANLLVLEESINDPE